MTAQLEKIVIAGASVAGTTVADELRQGGFTGTITMLSDERHLPYDRPPLSKQMLSSDSTTEPIALRDPGHFVELGIDLLLGHGAAGLDIDRRYVITTDGDPLPWDALVIATGSRPRTVTTVAGESLPSLRTVEDVLAIREAAAEYGRVTLVGSSFIGMEIAASLRSRGIEVTVFGAMDLPLNQGVGPEVAADLRDLHLGHGTDLRLGALIVSVAGSRGNYELTLADGSVHRTPYVISGIGIQPNTEWLIGSGVEPDPAFGGVLCNAAGRTNVPGIWAAGDVAQYDHPVLGPRAHVGHWTNAAQQARHVAANILAAREDPYTAIPYFWTDQFDRKIQCHGRRHPQDSSVVVEGSIESGEYLVLYGSAGNFHAVLSCGRDRSLRKYVKLLRRQASWDEALAEAGQLHSTGI
ncbi:NAD(P)/FAD-dependent oxidoreductase [Paeniglutamicibacter sp.]|uniref:NAD(P)/FAD-dependent oxidoreductase n=1 Tax=Paeniglutamicibacter sp. TaxID=1934391 RepID=UPI0039895CC6